MLALIAAIFAIGKCLLGKGPYLFDPREEPGGFEPHANRYQSLAKLIVTLSAATIAYVVNFLVGIPKDVSLRSPYSLALESAAPLILCFLAASIFFALLFILLQSYFYEQYCHSINKDTYSGTKYSLSMAVAHSSLFWFFASFAYLAWRLFS